MTRIFGVMGWPIEHSLSPAMHTAALRAMKVDGLYAPFAVPPRLLTPILHGLVAAGVEGLNVTVPLKEAVVSLMDRLEGAARDTRAVNTIVIRRGRLVGYNTDAVGFLQAVRDLGWRPHSTRAVILGAGGAARAVAWAISRQRGSTVTIANRRLKRAQVLARWLRRVAPRVRVCATTLSQVRLEEAELLVNATTLGMRASDRCPIDVRQLHRGLLVYDLVYQRETPLIRAARRLGCVAANGSSMLLYQGAESLHLWLHRTPPVTTMRRALTRALRA